MTDWKFSDPANTAVLVDRRIIHGGDWIAYVSHDEDDGGWQFHNKQSEPLTEGDAMVVSLRNIVEHDPSVSELADLPIGFCAWRDAIGSAWRRSKIEE